MMILFTKDFQAGLGLPQKLESLYCLPVKIPTGMITHPSKGQLISKRRLASRRFSKKMNGRI